jgi:phage terminase large subunit
MFVADKSANRLCIEIQYYDNEMFPASLEKLRLEMYNKGVRENDLSLYNHIWLGQFLELSKSSILAHLVKVEDFEIDASFGSPYIGVDWGFANDDNVVVTCYVKGRNLYIHRVGMALGLPLNKTASWLIDNAPDILNYTSYADCARPETISKMQEDGIPKIKSCTKGKIADGVSYLQSFDSIIMHPRAGRAVEVQKKALNELMSYSYKVENKGKPNEQVTPEIQDKFNNCADAIRYALQPLIMKKKNSFSLAV